MNMPKKIDLIDRDELVEVIMRSDCSTRENIRDIIYRQPLVAIAKFKCEIEMYLPE